MDTELKIEYMDIAEISAYENNAKLHPHEQVCQIAESIRQFGMNDPLAIWNGTLVEGHGRLQACKMLGITSVPVIRLDHLSDEQRRAYTLVHNQVTLNSPFDLDILGKELANIVDIDMGDFGFDIIPDFDILGEAEDESIEPLKMEQTIQCPHCGGDIEVKRYKQKR